MLISKKLGKNVRPAAGYLLSRLGEPVKVRRNLVKFADINARLANLLLQKFLRQSLLEGYSILVVNFRTYRSRSSKKGEEAYHSYTEGANPFAWETIPDQWYFYSARDNPRGQEKQERQSE